MIENLFAAIETWAKRGMYFPFTHDPVTNKPSVTLMFFYLSFMLAIGAITISSAAMLIKGDYLTATIMPTLLAVVGFIFYRLRNLDRVKIDLDDKQIELSSDDKEEGSKDA